MTFLRAIGLMSGTSMDGIDVAMIETDGETIRKFGPSAEYPYDEAVRGRIEQGLLDAAGMDQDRRSRPGTLASLERELSELHAVAVIDFVQTHDIDPKTIDVIGFHGQTVLHRPDAALTVQLGDGQLLARKTGINVVCDMRAADMEAGGQGAPLAPAYHRALAKSGSLTGQSSVVFVNIGGISNITHVSSSGEMIAFDTGPGNNLIDQWMQEMSGLSFDNNGDVASRGKILAKIVDDYMSVPYFEAPLPKSLDRADFKPLAITSATLEDGARTLVRVTAEAIAASIDHLPEKPGLWVICGGARKNKMIMQDLEALLSPGGDSVITAEQAKFNGDTIEAEAFAYLAVRSLKGLPLTFPATTGCSQETTGGVLFSP